MVFWIVASVIACLFAIFATAPKRDGGFWMTWTPGVGWSWGDGGGGC